jgi:hypothetical protein
MLRHWYIPLGILACAALAFVMLARDGGIYTTRTVISLMLPASTTLSPGNGTNDSNIIAFAAVVVRDINDSRPPARYSTDDAPYYGAGIREGALVQLTNSGNQWVSTFSKAEIEVQVVGRTLDWTKAKQSELVSKVLSTARYQQATVGIPPANRIIASVVPLTTQIEFVSPSRSSQLTAAAAMFVAAVIIGAWASVTVDRLRSRRRSSAHLEKGSTS